MAGGIFLPFFLIPNLPQFNPNNTPSRRILLFPLIFYNERGLKNSQKTHGKESAFMNKKQTSKTVAAKASQILRDGRYGSKAKSVAGSALAQTKTGKKK